MPKEKATRRTRANAVSDGGKKKKDPNAPKRGLYKKRGGSKMELDWGGIAFLYVKDRCNIVLTTLLLNERLLLTTMQAFAFPSMFTVPFLRQRPSQLRLDGLFCAVSSCLINPVFVASSISR